MRRALTHWAPGLAALDRAAACGARSPYGLAVSNTIASVTCARCRWIARTRAVPIVRLAEVPR